MFIITKSEVINFDHYKGLQVDGLDRGEGILLLRSKDGESRIVAEFSEYTQASNAFDAFCDALTRGDRTWKLPATVTDGDPIDKYYTWTPEVFQEKIPPERLKHYIERNQAKRLCEFGVDLMNLVQEKQWALTYRFQKYYFAFYLGRRLVFGVNLHSHELVKLAIWLPEDIIHDRELDWHHDVEIRSEVYYASSGCSVYPEHITVENLQKLLEFAYMWYADLL